MASDTAKRNVLIASALGSSLAPYMVSALIVALPTIGHEFSADAASLGWVTTIFFLAAALFLVPFCRGCNVSWFPSWFLCWRDSHLLHYVEDDICCYYPCRNCGDRDHPYTDLRRMRDYPAEGT
jgi:hypothetical protein